MILNCTISLAIFSSALRANLLRLIFYDDTKQIQVQNCEDIMLKLQQNFDIWQIYCIRQPKKLNKIQKKYIKKHEK
ncbi:hypothetical protein BpHYR1_023512 [Brachionus plicatilis]|uniref:Uncharacterized protein n=1 Tax=Brachionus plicatilis TaxID=10195 RepID=A0A3M7PZR3_BRAPC|nr:hypothetical protein BpHYR1_023512 [Brachionus plicatilis]